MLLIQFAPLLDTILMSDAGLSECMTNLHANGVPIIVRSKSVTM
jgi:hypothetical protein